MAFHLLTYTLLDAQEKGFFALSLRLFFCASYVTVVLTWGAFQTSEHEHEHLSNSTNTNIQDSIYYIMYILNVHGIAKLLNRVQAAYAVFVM